MAEPILNGLSQDIDVNAIINAALLAAHPVGSYYWSSIATDVKGGACYG